MGTLNAPVAVRRIAPPADDRRTTAGRSRILFVDDDEWLCQQSMRRLAADGHEVFCAASGDEALLLLDTMHDERWPCDGLELLVLDAQMPGRSGFEVLRELRDTRRGVPVLLMAYPDGALDHAIDGLAALLLVKPFSLDKLSIAVDVALRVTRGVS